MKKGDLVKVVIGPKEFLGMVGVVIDMHSISEECKRDRRRHPIVEIVETHDLGGDSYNFYHDVLEILSEAPG